MSLFNLLLLPFLFIIFFTFAYADNYPSDSCNNPRSVPVPGTSGGHLIGNGHAPFEEDFFTITVPSNGQLHIWSTGYDNDLDAFLYDDSSCNNEIKKDTRGANTTHDIDLIHSVTGGSTYKLKVRGWKGNSSYTLHIELIPTTSWVKPNSTTAYTDPQPYQDNIDITTTLAITGATQLDITITGSIEDHDSCIWDYLVITDEGGGTRKFCGAINETYTVTGSSISLFFHSDGGVVDNGVQVSIATMMMPIQAIDDSFTTNANTQLTTGNVLSNDTGTNIEVIANTQPSNGSVVMQADGSFVYTPPLDFTGTTTFIYTISNDGGTTTSQATVTIAVEIAILDAVDDNYDTLAGSSINGNLLDNDSGTGITLTSNTSPTKGTLVISAKGDFTYTPYSYESGTDTFFYTITDSSGSTDDANVTIEIETDFTEGSYLPFELVNPPGTRNVIGNYQIAGNTVLCLTAKTSGYGGECTDIQNVTSNMRVSKYLDIDNNGGTWNSTSSYINFDAPYSPTRGIVWAGLFWGGRISTDDNHPIRYAVENAPDAFSTIEVGDGGSGGSIDIETTGATNIKLKIDDGSYAEILASRFHTSAGSGGETYAAFADVSAVIQSANLSLGKHTFTVANLTTMEGREPSPGAFGGWSLVVIYAEDYTNGKPRNISIYNGFIDIGTSNDPIEISGFKLPTSGNVQAQLSVFSGEGEYLYGRRVGNNNSDWMKISDQESSGYSYMPGKTAGTHLGNRDNMFDAQLDNILRDNISGEFNDLSINNVGVDVDTYDVSALMTTYRNNDENLSSIYIQMYSNNDYITPSMMAFSAELYVPELCYDYTLDIDGHVLDSINNEIKTPFGGFGQDLTTVIYLKSLEGDIPLSDISVNYRILDPAHLTYKDCTTEISETGEYDYSDACSYTYSASDTGFSMYAGTGKTTSSGGVITALENRYIKFDSEFKKSVVDTSFEFSVDYTVNYGSGAVPLRKTFTANDLCEPINEGFFPELGYFNITDSTNEPDEWNLYTQTSNRAFNLKLYAYDASNPTDLIGNDLNNSVEIEMIRADNFNRDANTACNDEHSLLNDVPRKFIHFNESKGVEFRYNSNEVNLAYRSTGMRVWYLTDAGGNGFLIDDHNCTRANQDECIVLYNREYTGGGQCGNECRTNLSTGNCYNCLRSYYGRKVCSRDNFSIRPESFITQIFDSNQSEDTTKPNNPIADSTDPVIDIDSAQFSLIAGYKYRFDINATNHINNTATPRYRQHFSPGSPIHRISMDWFPNGHTVTGCNDVIDQNISLNIFNGSSVNPVANTSYVDNVDQIGKYRFSVFDQNWTNVDWDADQMTHHTDAIYSSYYRSGEDCIKDSSTVWEEEDPTTEAKKRQGCLISSVHTNADTGEEYNYLYTRYHPYTFNTAGLTIGAGPTNDKGFAYINTLNRALYPDGVDENMSFNIQGTFLAAGYTGDTVSNFVDNCYAVNVDMTLQHAYLSDVPANGTHNLVADLIDHNTTDISLTYPSDDDITDRIRTTFTNTLIKNATTDLTITQNTNVFAKDMQGAITMDLGFNFDRTNDQLLNPRRINFSDFNITYSTQPATVFVDLITDYQIFGNRNIDQNITFLYARAKPGKTFYDDVTDTSILTPVSVVTYCDLGYTECQNRGIMALDAQTNEAYWWKSVDHKNQAGQDGNIVFALGSPTEGSGTPTISATSAAIIANGEDDTITVGSGADPVLPLNVPINLVVNDPTNSPYTDRWLIYNEYNATQPPLSPFYRVRFIGDSSWSGVGKTGNVVGNNASSKKTKRLDW